MSEVKVSEIFQPCSQGYEHSPMMHVQDQKPSGTDGGASVAGDNPRDLNTVLTNEIVGASLSSNEITLPAGKYWVDAESPMYGADQSKVNIVSSAGDTLLFGVNAAPGAGVGTAPGVCGALNLSSTTTISSLLSSGRICSSTLG